MGYLFGFIWCLAFGSLGFFLSAQRKKYANYQRFTGRVKEIRTKGRNVAVINSGIPEIGEFEFSFNDLGDYNEGNEIDCMWDGKNPSTAQEDLRDNQKLGIYFSFGAVAVMVMILILGSIFG